MNELRVRLFGSFQLLVGNRDLSHLLGRKAQEFLSLALLAAHRRVLREGATDTLWPTATAVGSRKAMRQVLWQIHQTTDTCVPESLRLILTEGEALRINPHRQIWLDVAVFVEAAQTARTTSPDALTELDLRELAGGANLHRGPLLAGYYEDWCALERAHLDDLYLTLLDRLSVAYEHRGRLDEAIRWAEGMLEVEPAHERSHRRLMRLYYLTDDRTRALRQYARCRWLLEHELGVQPSTRTESLAAAIRADSGAFTDAGEVLAHPARDTGVLDALRQELAAIRASVDAIHAQLSKSPA